MLTERNRHCLSDGTVIVAVVVAVVAVVVVVIIVVVVVADVFCVSFASQPQKDAKSTVKPRRIKPIRFIKAPPL